MALRLETLFSPQMLVKEKFRDNNYAKVLMQSLNS